MHGKNTFPRLDFAREEWLNLNGEWDFSLDAPVCDKKIKVPYSWGSPLSGISESGNGAGFYRHTVEWNPSGKRIFLIFDAVDYTCVVRVNKTLLGGHRGGYAPFEFDVTDVWNRSGANTIEVTAIDTAERSQTYGKQGYGDTRGIWQTVRLEARPDAWISSFFVKTALDGTVEYEVEVSCASGSGNVAASRGVVTAKFGEASSSAEVIDGRAHICIKLSEPRLWTPENPNLYEGVLTLTADGGVDTVSTYFGVREIGTGVFGEHGCRYITLNGKPYYLNGVLDQSFNPKGFFTLPTDEDCREEILRLKRIGINMARIHIKAEEPLKLYWADRLGLLIMEDIPCFWGNPEPETMEQFERELEAQIIRDRNHPSTFCWVVFNETWGLYTRYKNADGSEKREYRTETAKWVENCFRRVKELDPTRLVEDNSPCNGDHTITDVNTWHFYKNGYKRVKDVISGFCDKAFAGSKHNYKDGYTMADVPCMNSECGNVWGITGNAGESDISWQYRYMINEFRLHDKLCGFVFTEFHDVVNEFNGYYKINNGDKDFGYSEYGTSLHDLHSQDYLGADFAPMTTVKPGDKVTLPMFGSSFTDLRHGKQLDIVWELCIFDALGGGAHTGMQIRDARERTVCSGTYSIIWKGYGSFDAGAICAHIPEHSGVAVLTWTLRDGAEKIMSNCVLFDIDGTLPEHSLEPSDFEASGFTRTIPAISGAKFSGLGAGEFTAQIETSAITGFGEKTSLRLIFEASTRAAMTHDYPKDQTPEKVDLNYMLGYRCDPGANHNSFPQTDEVVNPGRLEVLINGEKIAELTLPDCPADSRGALSHHYQPTDKLLDEAGSYGYLCDVGVPSRSLIKITGTKSFALTLRMTDDAGLSLYGRRSGRYGIGIVVAAV